MMELINDVQHLVFLAILALLWWLWIEVKRYRLDKTRQAIFSIRDKLFMRAARGEIDFDSDAYQLTRTLLNSAIRYAERISLLRIAAVQSALERHNVEGIFSSRMRRALEGATHEQKRLILDCVQELDKTLILHMLRSSIVSLLLLEIMRGMRLLGRARKAIAGRVRQFEKTINNDIFLDESFA